jgi:hypothetical protein
MVPSRVTLKGRSADCSGFSSASTLFLSDHDQTAVTTIKPYHSADRRPLRSLRRSVEYAERRAHCAGRLTCTDEYTWRRATCWYGVLVRKARCGPDPRPIHVTRPKQIRIVGASAACPRPAWVLWVGRGWHFRNDTHSPSAASMSYSAYGLVSSESQSPTVPAAGGIPPTVSSGSSWLSCDLPSP